MGYNGLNQLTSAYIDGVEASYSYRPDGLRHAKTVDGVTTRHLWDGQNIVADAVNGSIQQKYIRGIGLLAVEDSQGTRTGYLFNAHGDVIQRTDSAGNVLKGYDYDAFGVEKAPEDADQNPFRYCGEYFDAETGSVYLRNRYYNPRLGRFTREDPARDGLNWYTYANGNPVRFIDPTGLSSIYLYPPSEQKNSTGFSWEELLVFFSPILWFSGCTPQEDYMFNDITLIDKPLYSTFHSFDMSMMYYNLLCICYRQNSRV